MSAEQRRDQFGTESQKNARVDGSYWQIAAEQEAKGCVFCRLKEKYVIETNDKGALTVNIFPYIDGQLVVIPHRHMETFGELTAEEASALHDLNQRGIQLLNEKMGIDNIWLILRDGNVAGKTVKHLHWNIMPYQDGMNTWHYDRLERTIAPVDLATKLREDIGHE
jgi:diadenosine tetraphosphate (Ap4A) HIT family hydrolase